MITRLNGEVVQKTRTSKMLNGTHRIISYISQYITLEPGDVIYTGTSGTTSSISTGDIVEVQIEGIGTLKNPVRAPNK